MVNWAPALLLSTTSSVLRRYLPTKTICPFSGSSLVCGGGMLKPSTALKAIR